jgi:NAD+ synthase
MKNLILTPEELESCRKKIQKAIKAIVEESNSTGVVVALSGGLDSSVVLKLASGAVDTYALIMPEMNITPEEDIQDAEELAKSLGVRYSVIEIGDVVNSVRKAFPWAKFDQGNRRISDANIKPRARMIFSYLLANLEKRIVLGTGNRTEILLGYATKYGDSACDLQPIGDLYKTHVMQLAEYLGLPRRIIEKKPSAGLWKNQTDEEELGAGYDDIDSILHLLVDKEFSTEKTAKELNLGFGLVADMNSRMGGGRHKRETPEITQLA